jgi:hypothetical protein
MKYVYLKFFLYVDGTYSMMGEKDIILDYME